MALEDEEIFADRALLDWAREAPRSPAYDEELNEEQAAALEYERQKWMESRPNVPSGYDDDSSIRVTGPGTHLNQNL
jgi:hypothetical protein